MEWTSICQFDRDSSHCRCDHFTGQQQPVSWFTSFPCQSSHSKKKTKHIWRCPKMGKLPNCSCFISWINKRGKSYEKLITGVPPVTLETSTQKLFGDSNFQDFVAQWRPKCWRPAKSSRAWPTRIEKISMACIFRKTFTVCDIEAMAQWKQLRFTQL